MTINLKNLPNAQTKKLSKMGDFQELKIYRRFRMFQLVSADLYKNGRDDICFVLFSSEGAQIMQAAYTKNSSISIRVDKLGTRENPTKSNIKASIR